MMKPELMRMYGEEAEQATIELNKYEEQIEKLKKELETYYKREVHHHQLKPGQTDSWRDDLSYYEKVCIDPAKASKLQSEIDKLEHEKQQYIDIIDKCVTETQNKQYEELQKEKMEKAEKQAIVDYHAALDNARDGAKERYKNLPKFKKALAVVTGQRNKHRKIMHKLNQATIKNGTISKEEYEKAYRDAAEQLDRLYGGRRGR